LSPGKRIALGDEGAFIIGERIAFRRGAGLRGAAVVMFLRCQHGGRGDDLFKTIWHGRSFTSFCSFINFVAG